MVLLECNKAEAESVGAVWSGLAIAIEQNIRQFKVGDNL